MSQQPPPKPVPNGTLSGDDPWLTRGREVITALLALIVVIGTAILIASAFKYVSVDDTKDLSFQHAKDLLNIVLPLLGVVLGYYFNKVSTEKRAEAAEKSAQKAEVVAQQANEVKQTVQLESERTKDSLRDVAKAAEKLLAPESYLETLGEPTSAATVSDEARLELKSALDRARRYI